MHSVLSVLQSVLNKDFLHSTKVERIILLAYLKISDIYVYKSRAYIICDLKTFKYKKKVRDASFVC